MVLPVKAKALLVLTGRMVVGMRDWMETIVAVYAPGEAFGGLGKAGLITIIVVFLIAIVAFAWIFRETRKRE
jgi:hypothetical protein